MLPGVGRHRQRPRGRAAGPHVRSPDDRATAGLDGAARRRCCPDRSRARSPSCSSSSRASLFGVRDPHGLPPAVPRPARPGRRARGLGAGLGDARPRRHRRHLRARGRARRDGRDRRRRAARPRASRGSSAVEPRLCIFEFVYFARPDSRLYGREVHERPLPHGRAAGRRRRRSRPTW